MEGDEDGGERMWRGKGGGAGDWGEKLLGEKEKGRRSKKRGRTIEESKLVV